MQLLYLSLIRHCLLVCLSLAVGESMAQEGGNGSFSYLSHLKGDTLLVCQYEDGSGYDEAIARAISQHWTFTPYRMVSVAELEARISTDRKSYCMLVRDNTERSRHGQGRTHLIRRNHLAIYPCIHGAKLYNYHGRLAITQFEVEDIDEVSAYLALLPAFVQAMQHYVMFLDQQQEVLNLDNFDKLRAEARAGYLGDLKAMKLFLLAEQLPRQYQESDWLKAYPYDLAIINQDALPYLLEEQAAGYAFLHVAPEGEEFRVLGLGDGRVYDVARPQKFKAFAPKDLKLLSKRIQQPAEDASGILGRLLNW